MRVLARAARLHRFPTRRSLLSAAKTSSCGRTVDGQRRQSGPPRRASGVRAARRPPPRTADRSPSCRGLEWSFSPLAAAVGVRFIVDHPVRTIRDQRRSDGEGAGPRPAHGDPRRPRVHLGGLRQGRAIPFREDDDVMLGPTKNMRGAYACSKGARRVAGACATRASAGSRSSSPGSSTRSGRGRPAVTAWSSRRSPLPRSAARRSSCTGPHAQTRVFARMRDTVEALVAPRSRVLPAPTRGRQRRGGREVSILELARNGEGGRGQTPRRS